MNREHSNLETGADPQCFCAHRLSNHAGKDGRCTADLGGLRCGCLSFLAWQREMQDRPLTGTLAEAEAAVDSAVARNPLELH